jgi:hypothetical protein
MSWPSKTILPAVGSSSRVSSRPVVVLPQPDSPTSDSVSPLRTLKSRPSTAYLALQHAAPDREVLDQAGHREQLFALADLRGVGHRVGRRHRLILTASA